MKQSSIVYSCPFFRWDEKLGVRCEGGRVRFPDGETRRLYIKSRCAHVPGWEHCTLAAALMGYYDRMDGRPRRGGEGAGHGAGEI